MMAAVIAAPSISSDAEKTEIIDGISINTDDINSESLSRLLSSLMQSILVLNDDTLEVDFGSDTEKNYSDLMDALGALKSGSKYSEEDIKEVVNNLGVLGPMMVSSTGFVPSNDVVIQSGSIATAVDFPEYLIKMLTADNDDPVQLYGSGEMGFLMDLTTAMDVQADDKIDKVGLFTTDMVSTLMDGLGPLASIFDNVLVSDNPGLTSGMDVEIGKDAKYHAVTKTDLAVYTNFSLNTNVNKAAAGDDIFAYFDIEIKIAGSIDVELTKISGNGPEKINSDLAFNSVDLGLELGFNNLDSSSGNPGFHLGINGLKFDMTYGEEVDGKKETANVRNSSVMAIANGIKVNLKNDDNGIINVDIANPSSDIPDKERSADMQRIIDKADQKTTVEKAFDPTMQYTVGGCLALVGIIIIAAMAIGKKY